MYQPSRRAFLGSLVATLVGGSGCTLNSSESAPFTLDQLLLRNASIQPRTFDIRITRSRQELFSETYTVTPPEPDDVPPWNTRRVSAPIGEQQVDIVSVTIDGDETHRIGFTKSDPPESQCMVLSIRIEEGGQYLRFEHPCVDT